MSDDDWRFAAGETTRGKLKNKFALAQLKLGTLIRLIGLAAVALTAYNFFAFAIGGVPVAAFWPALLSALAPAGMATVTTQVLAAIIGATVVWFF